jgi:hypothetical protein
MAKITIEFDTDSEQDMVQYKKALQAPAMYLALAELKYHTFSDDSEMQERVAECLRDFNIDIEDMYDDPLLT